VLGGILRDQSTGCFSFRESLISTVLNWDGDIEQPLVSFLGGDNDYREYMGLLQTSASNPRASLM